MTDRMLLIGANSYVGRRITGYFDSDYFRTGSGFEFIGTYHENSNPFLSNQLRVDITNKGSVQRAICATKPNTVIITASRTNTKDSLEDVSATNIGGILHILSALEEQSLDARIFVFSSNYVFDGKKALYTEQEKTSPLQPYGFSKAVMECLMRDKNGVVLRCPMIIGTKRRCDKGNFVSYFIESQESLNIFNNVYRTTLLVNDIPQIIDILIKKNISGRLINVSNSSCMNYTQMADIIRREFDIARKDNVVNCTDPSIPKRLVLSNGLLKQLTGFTPTSFEESVRHIKREMKL